MAVSGFLERIALLFGRDSLQQDAACADFATHPEDRHEQLMFGAQDASADYRPIARALLRAMRNPSVAMINVGARTIDGLQPTPEAMAETIWQRMIDAALDEIK